MLRKRTDFIVLHCSATRACQDIGAKEIRRWHMAKGWKDIGYHFVIRLDGRIEKGRALTSIGSHVAGHNGNSVGICLVGGLDDAAWQPASTYTSKQWSALKVLLTQILTAYPNAKILGHRDFKGVAKACPCFDAKPWARRNGLPAVI
jgi:N-acetylmuramoyl-L-alanine amidase